MGSKEVEPLNIEKYLKILFEKWEVGNSIVLIKKHRTDPEFLKIGGQWFLNIFCFRMSLSIVIDIYCIRNLNVEIVNIYID